MSVLSPFAENSGVPISLHRACGTKMWLVPLRIFLSEIQKESGGSISEMLKNGLQYYLRINAFNPLSLGLCGLVISSSWLAQLSCVTEGFHKNWKAWFMLGRVLEDSWIHKYFISSTYSIIPSIQYTASIYWSSVHNSTWYDRTHIRRR